MCLKVDKNLKLDFQPSEDGRQRIVAYKVVLTLSNKITSPLYSFTWKEGWNYSSRWHKEVSDIELVDRIDQGFHVYLTKEDAIMAKDSWLAYNYSYDSQIIPVCCYENDFVAAGYDRGFKSAVFTKVMK